MLRNAPWPAAGLLTLLSGCVLLLPPAQAQYTNTLWSATLTVGTGSGQAGRTYTGCDNQVASVVNCSTALSRDNFTYDDRNVKIVYLNRYTQSGQTFDLLVLGLPQTNASRLGLPSAILNRGSLHIDNKSFKFKDIEYQAGGFWAWDNHGITWTGGEQVQVSIKISSSEIPAPILNSPTPGNGQVTLSWAAVGGVRGFRYKVWEGTGENERAVTNWVWFSGSYGDTTSGVVTGLTNGTTYTFRVHAMERALVTYVYPGGNVVRREQWVSGPDSAPVTATPVGPPPTRCTSTITGDGSVTGRWSGRYRFGDWIPECASAKRGDNYAAQYYRLTLDQESRVTLDLRSSAAGTHLYLWGGINRQSGTPLAEDSGISWGRSGFSSRIERTLPAGAYTVEATTFAELDDGQFTLTVGGLGGSTPDAVSDINVTHNGSSLAVSWTAPSLAASYDVTYYNRNTGVNARAAWRREGTSLIIRCDSRDGMQNQNCIEQGGSYTVGVRARNSSGALTSSWANSAPVSYQTPSEREEQERIERSRPPDAVTWVNVVHNGGRLRVTWEAPARATHYDVTYYRHDTGVNARAAWNRSGTSITITRDSRSGQTNTVSSSATYTVGVRARNANGESAWTNSAPAAPPALSVADASVSEPATGRANLNFTVTLAPTSTETVTVEYATADGTATQPADYTQTTGTLTFSPGASTRRVSVPVLADSVNEGRETLVLRLSNATKARITQAQATGSIHNDGPIPAAWNARFGRTVADQVLEGVETRLRSAPAPGVDVYLAGERLEWPAASDGTQPVAQQVADQLAQWLVVGSGDNGDAALRTVNGDDLLSSSSFALASPTSGGGLLSFWGRGAVTNFDGREGELTLDGQVRTVMLGTDWRWGQWPDGGETRRSIAGLLLSRSTADGGYTRSDAGEVDAILTGVFPWIGHRFTHQLEAWGTAGYGQGELQVTPKLDTAKDGATLTADLNLWLAAGGLRGTLVDGGSEGLTLTGKGDAMVVGTSSGETRGMKAAEATVTRLRLGLEAQRPFALGNPDSVSEAGSSATLTPSLEVELRHDGGDAETGFGLDLGGGIVLSHTERGLQAEVRGRGLLSHAAEGFRDRGFSGSLSWQQRPDSDLGAALSLTQTMGGLSSGGADALLSRATLEGLTANAGNGNDDLNNQRLELQLSYGLPAFGDRFTLTPEVGLGFYDSGRDYRLGWSLTQPDDGETFAFSFDVTRRENGNGDGSAPEHGVELRLDTLF